MITKESFIVRFQNAGGKINEEMMAFLDDHWDNVSTAAARAGAAMPGIGFLSRTQRWNAFMATCRYLDQLREKEGLTGEEAFMAMTVLRVFNKKFMKAIIIFELTAMRAGLDERLSMPQTAQDYLRSIEVNQRGF